RTRPLERLPEEAVLAVAESSHGSRLRRVTAPSELVIVDAVAKHDEQADEELPSDGHFCFRVTSAAEQRCIKTMEILVVADRNACGLHKNKSKQWVALLRDLTQMVLIGGSVEGRRQADVAGDLLGARKPADGPEDNHGW